jgi:hypothetical protein
MTLEDYILIEEILAEANAYGVKSNVQKLAEQYAKDGLDIIEAYQKAFKHWTK